MENPWDYVAHVPKIVEDKISIIDEVGLTPTGIAAI